MARRPTAQEWAGIAAMITAVVGLLAFVTNLFGVGASSTESPTRPNSTITPTPTATPTATATATPTATPTSRPSVLGSWSGVAVQQDDPTEKFGVKLTIDSTTLEALSVGKEYETDADGNVTCKYQVSFLGDN